MNPNEVAYEDREGDGVLVPTLTFTATAEIVRYLRADPIFVEGESMRYHVKLKQSEEGCEIWCSGLPGCWSQGKTESEALENIKDAIRDYIATAELSLGWDKLR